MIQSVQRALRLLNEVAATYEGVGLRELARRTDLAPTTAHNLLKTLQACGFLEFHQPSGRYQTGLAAVRIARHASPSQATIEFVREDINRLFEVLNETIVVLMMHQDDVSVVDWREPDHPLAVRFRSDVDRCPFQMASGKALLAWQPESWLREYVRRTESMADKVGWPSSVAELSMDLHQVQEQGYAVSDDVAGSGVGALGAPVFDAAGNVALSIGISAPLSRLDKHTRAHHLELLLATTQKLTSKLQAQDTAKT